MKYLLGADVGATKTHVLIADGQGHALGFGRGGPGNHQTVGYDGLAAALKQAADQALGEAGLSTACVAGAGFGVAGYDWPAQTEPILAAIGGLGLTAPVRLVNDTLVGLLAGSEQGWGVAVVAGTGCNCHGWDRSRTRHGSVTGGGSMMGEAAGATELLEQAVRAAAQAWTGRGPATQLSSALLQRAGAGDIVDLLSGLIEGRFRLPPDAARLVFEAAQTGDVVAQDLIRWAGRELGEMARAVIRQLQFAELEFDLVLVGGLFDGRPPLLDSLRAPVLELAPRARFVRLSAPPVVGAVLLGAEAAGLNGGALRPTLIETTARWLS
jgi:N-acetylglucosamine kinase-like BadF-type ATPase